MVGIDVRGLNRMSKLYVLAGRPGERKTEYLEKAKAQYGDAFQLVSAKDYCSHEDLMKALYDHVQDDRCKCIAIDDYEVSLIRNWGNCINDADYRRKLSIMSGFSDAFNVSIIVVAGLKREADAEENIYSDKAFLRSKALDEETDDIFFVKQGSLNKELRI